jgi:hypothetical protein
MSTRRYTVSMPQFDRGQFSTKVPHRTRNLIEKLSEAVNKMGGQVRTHVQDNGGKESPNPQLT